jgi:hypothetical protein
MDKIIRYSILPELSLIIEYLSGKVDGDDAINLKKIEKNDPKYNANYNCLVDFRDTEVYMNNEGKISMSKFIEFFKGEKELLSKRKSALLTSEPQQVVLSSLLKDFSIELPMYFEIFSTLHSSVAYINCLPGDIQVINDELAKLKTIAA